MRVGFLGNANNFPFMLARAMRGLGHDVQFVVSSGNLLDRPETRFNDLSRPYPDWIHDMDLGPLDWRAPTPRRSRLIRLLNGCDGIVLNQLAPTLKCFLNKPALVLLTGTDLNVYCDLNIPSKLAAEIPQYRNLAKSLLWHLLGFQVRKAHYAARVHRQREGVRAALAVSYFPRGLAPDGDALLDELGIDSSRRFFFMMTAVDELHYCPPPDNVVPRVFCGARLNWVRPIPDGCCELDYKGSDIMIRGVAAFCHETGMKLDIRLVRKGLHVAETMQLIDQLQLGGNVSWRDELTQIEFLEECRKADIVFDQFGQSVVGMAGMDAMALGRPVIANGRPEIFRALLGVESQICQSVSPDEVASQLKRLVLDPAERHRVGIASRQYVSRYFSAEHAARMCLERLGAT